MEKKVLNYQIIIEKEGKNYNAYCPGLGLADWGKTVDEAIKNITATIKFHLETLKKLGHKLPVERETISLITSVSIPSSAKSFACP